MMGTKALIWNIKLFTFIGYLVSQIKGQCFSKYDASKITATAIFENSLIIIAEERKISLFRNVTQPSFLTFESEYIPKKIISLPEGLVLQTEDDMLLLYNVDMRKKKTTYKGRIGESRRILDIASNPTENQLITTDGTEILFWDLEELQLRRRLAKVGIKKLILSERNLILISNQIEEFDLDTNRVYKYGVKLNISSAKNVVHHDGILFVPLSNTILFVDTNKKSVHYKINENKNFEILDMAISPKHNILTILESGGDLFTLALQSIFSRDESIPVSEEPWALFKTSSETAGVIQSVHLFKDFLFLQYFSTVHEYHITEWPTSLNNYSCPPTLYVNDCDQCTEGNKTDYCLICSQGKSPFLRKLQGNCSIGCKSCDKNYMCLMCDTGYFLNNSVCYSLYCYDPNCRYCKPLNNRSCEQCITGYNLNYYGNCTKNSYLSCYVSNCQTCSTYSSYTCSNCNSGYYLSSGECRSNYASCYISYCNYCDSYDSYWCASCYSGYVLSNGYCYYRYYSLDPEPSSALKGVATVGIIISALGLLWGVIVFVILVRNLIRVIKKHKKQEKKQHKHNNNAIQMAMYNPQPLHSPGTFSAHSPNQNLDVSHANPAETSNLNLRENEH